MNKIEVKLNELKKEYDRLLSYLIEVEDSIEKEDKETRKELIEIKDKILMLEELIGE